MSTSTVARQAEALDRAQTGRSYANYDRIVHGFAAKGISDAKPRENVYTYAAWRALGRNVRKGEHGIGILTYISGEVRDRDSENIAPKTGEVRKHRFHRPWTVTVFHVSQTDPR